MDIGDFKRVLVSFADDQRDVDVRIGKVVAQLRDEIVDASLSYSSGPERSLVVTENDTQYPARLWLTNRVAKIPQLADRILSATASSVAAGSDHAHAFVTPSGSMTRNLSRSGAENSDVPVPDAVFSLQASAEDQLPGATSVLYLTSDAGEGKTTVINRAARLQAQRYKEKKTATLIVPIPLSGRLFLTFDDAVIAALVNKLRFNYFYFDAFIELVKMGVVVPAFDGYEEMLVEGSKGEAVSALGGIVQRLDSCGAIIVSARKAFFEYVSFKTQARLLDAIGDKSAEFSRIALSRWSRQQFCEYGRRRGAVNPDEVYQAVSNRLTPQHPLLTRAVLVKRLFDIVGNGKSHIELIALLGKNPDDYFKTFVTEIVKREASEKWLVRVQGDVSVPLLTVDEHHQLLAMISQEMWQSSTTSIRPDILGAIVELFSETAKKGVQVVRQIKERIRQHALLTVDGSASGAVSFDHEDFQNFYLGESLGGLLARGTRSEIQAFCSINVIPVNTIEQAVQNLLRNGADLVRGISMLCEINESEAGYSFCRENCSAISLRMVEGVPRGSQAFVFSSMFFSAGILSGRNLHGVQFRNCHFQPTSLENLAADTVEFVNCEFERLDLISGQKLSGIAFDQCKVDCVSVYPDGDQYFDPATCFALLATSGARLVDQIKQVQVEASETDERVQLLERFLRCFLRQTHVDDELIRIRVGKAGLSVFHADVLPALLRSGVLEEVQWRGRGVQKRYRLTVAMAEIDSALQVSRSDFDALLVRIGRSRPGA